MNINSRILQQFKKEIETWLRLLEFTRTENIHLKTRVAEVAGDEMDDTLLADMEEFHSQFLQIDEMIFLEKHEIFAFEKLVNAVYSPAEDTRNLFKMQKKIRNEMEVLEQKFNRLKFGFNFYLSDKL